MIEIKPCPFCGAERKIQEFENGTDIPDCAIECSECFAKGGAATVYTNAIILWNNRYVG